MLFGLSLLYGLTGHTQLALINESILAITRDVARDSLDRVLTDPRFIALDEEIRRGVERCHETCSYAPYCGGGPPGNKFFENGDFATTETLSCRLHKQVTFDVALTKLERVMAPAS